MSGKEHVYVLAVDDKPANLLGLEEILNSPEISVVRAASGNEALARLLEIDFACALLDVKIPDMDGFELASFIRHDARTKHLPIIFLSGHNKSDVDIDRGYELGAVDYLMKPFDPNILRSKVNVFAELYRKDTARQRAETELRKAKQELELRVAERTRELRERAEELARSNIELAQFAYVSSHDLKEPLRNVSIYAQLLQRRLKDGNKDCNDCLSIILSGTARMQKLIDDLLSYSRVSSPQLDFRDVDLNEVLPRVLEDLRSSIEQTSAQIDVGSLPRVTGRESQFASLFQNLIGNALKFRGEPAPVIRIRSETDEKGHHFIVTDNGIGIDPRYHDRIFEIFQQLHPRERYPGTGIGLAVCKKTIELHGGKIWVESQEGGGASFHFTLPARDSQRGTHWPIIWKAAAWF